MGDDDDDLAGGDMGITAENIREDTAAIVDETKHLMIEARSSFIILICGLLFMSLLSILLSTWLAKTITHSPASFGNIVTRYFGFNLNETERTLTWWTPITLASSESIAPRSRDEPNNRTTEFVPLKIPYSDYPNFHTIVLPLLFVGSIVLAGLAYYARVKCTNRDLAWGAVPKIPLGRVNPTSLKTAHAEPNVDYTIVQGTNEETVVFSLAETLEPSREKGDVIDEGTQYDPEDVIKVITHASSAPQLYKNAPLLPFDEQRTVVELFHREPLPTLSPKNNPTCSDATVSSL